MGNVLGGLQPNEVWNYFEEICKYPHPSKKEHLLANYIKDWAKQNNFTVKTDETGNIVVKKQATPGMENKKPVAIQGHIDMVCEKNSDVVFDFDKDPIQPYVDGDWVKAKGTTLGADNGIGIAMGMAVMTTDGIQHPPMELLCTLDEETGLTGAQLLSNDLLDAHILINLDSEEDGAFTIGCAGGINTGGSYKYYADAVPTDSIAYTIAIKGLRGGHSGIEIHDGRGNAIKLMTRLLYNIPSSVNYRLFSFNSGSKHNAIPRESFAVVTLPKSQEAEFLKYIANFDAMTKSEYATKEPTLNTNATVVELPNKVMTLEFQNNLIKSFYAMPHGPSRMSPDIDGLVQTSTNFAIVETKEDEVYVLTSQRSSVETEKVYMYQTVVCALELGGAKVIVNDGYPAWQPNINSPILNTAKNVFKGLFGKEPIIEAIHAGLECGLVGEKYPGMDMLSFGPNLKDVHSPDEKVQISTVQNCWKLLVEILKNIPNK